ncbi:MAG: carboxylating nicotinate-nucleotide diphosphorylase [Acidobacteriota bacterium]
MPPKPYALLYEPLLRRALREDLGRAGDLTSDAIVPVGAVAQGKIIARRAGRLAGLEIAATAFRLLDGNARITFLRSDADDATAGETLAEVSGEARALLSAERTCLNLLGRLCGIATATRDLVRMVEGTGASIVCTRKTTPGLRGLEKYAVRCGGGENHRFGLDDAVLIKDNHVAFAGGVRPAVERAREHVGHLVKIELEVDSLAQLAEALDLGVEVILLDNMKPAMLRQAVTLAQGRAVLEASGGITPLTARSIAETGVDLLSVGWITHSAPALDVAFDLDPALR